MLYILKGIYYNYVVLNISSLTRKQFNMPEVTSIGHMGRMSGCHGITRPWERSFWSSPTVLAVQCGDQKTGGDLSSAGLGLGIVPTCQEFQHVSSV